MRYFYALFMVSLLVAGCKKEATPTYAYTFTANASNFSGNVYDASYIRDSVSGKLKFDAKFYIGAKTDYRYIELKFSGNNYIDTGSYTNVGPLTYNRDGHTYIEQYGTYTINKLDTANQLISGTFQFTGYCSIETILYMNVTNGVFTNVKYVTQ